MLLLARIFHRNAFLVRILSGNGILNTKLFVAIKPITWQYPTGKWQRDLVNTMTTYVFINFLTKAMASNC